MGISELLVADPLRTRAHRHQRLDTKEEIGRSLYIPQEIPMVTSCDKKLILK